MITYLSLALMEHKITKGIWDKPSHFIAYLILFIIVKKVHAKSYYLTCAIACFAYSFIIECIQCFIPTRCFDGLDLIANSLGIFLGIAIYRLLIERNFEIEQNAI